MRWIASSIIFQVCFAKFADIQHVSIAKFANGSPKEQEEQVKKLRTAFETKGMVALVDVGFPEGLINKTMHSSRKFFALPAHTKEQYKEPSGYPPRSYGAITSPEGKIYKTQQRDDSGNILNEWLLVKNTSVAIDWNEPYYTSDEGREFYSSVSNHPEQSQWPSEVPELRQVTGAFYQAMEKLADTMHELFALALGISKDFFKSKAKHAPLWPVTIAHYPPQDTPPAEDQERIQPHWDRTLFSLITTSDYGDEDSEILVDKDTGDGVDGRAELEGRSTEWQKVRRPAGESFIINVGEVMSRWSNGRLKHVVHRVPNPKPGHRDPGRISLMAFVVPDYDTVVECLHCKENGSVPLYEKTWVGEMMNWGSKLPIYNQTKMEMMRMAQGLYTKKGHQTKLGEPTDVKSIEQMMSTKSIPVLDISALHNGTKDKQSFIARRLSEAFEQTGFAVVTGHGIAPELISNLRNKAYEFFRSPLEEKSKFDKGKGYGFGGYNSVGHENGAQLLGDFSRPNDVVESLHTGLAGLQSGVEAIQLKDSADHCSAKDISGCEMEENAPPVVARQAQSFLHAAERVAQMTSKALQLALNVSDEEMDLVLDPSGGGLRLAYYPSSKAYGENSMGYGSHIDSGGVTVISLDPANPHGLQVDISGVGTTGNDKDRIWVDVPFVPNSLVLNVGALLSRWTGHTWKASIHRVLPNRKIHERVSLITGALSPKVSSDVVTNVNEVPEAHKKHMADSEKEKGNEAFYSKDYQEAEAYYSRSLQYMADDPSTWANRALVRLKLDQAQDALEDCEHALALNGSHVKALHRKGKALYELQRYKDAVRAFQEALLLSPGNSQINGDLMVARRKLRDDEAAPCTEQNGKGPKQLVDAPSIAAVPLQAGYTRVQIEEDSDSEEEEKPANAEKKGGSGGFQKIAIEEVSGSEDEEVPGRFNPPPRVAPPVTAGGFDAMD